MTVPVVDAVPVPDRSRPGTNNIKDVYSALYHQIYRPGIKCGSDEYPVRSNSKRGRWRYFETGNYVEAGYTMSSNNHDVIVRFPEGREFLRYIFQPWRFWTVIV